MVVENALQMRLNHGDNVLLYVTLLSQIACGHRTHSGRHQTRDLGVDVMHDPVHVVVSVENANGATTGGSPLTDGACAPVICETPPESLSQQRFYSYVSNERWNDASHDSVKT